MIEINRAWRSGFMIVSARAILRLLLAAFLAGLCFVAGYLTASWRAGTREATLAQICGRIDYVSGLEEELPADQGQKVRDELKLLVEQCRVALRNRAEEND